MSHSIENRYIGGLRTHSIHLKSSDTIVTDAPVDNNGMGNAFSPTDLVASALCSCMTTVMGICAEKNNFELPGSIAYVTKIMESHPRRISKIIIEINFLGKLSKYALIVAMAGIGLKITIGSILKEGKSALIVGSLVFILQLIISTLLIFALL